jgi:hypothetical protein
MAILRTQFEKARRGVEIISFLNSAIFLGLIKPKVTGAYWMGVGAVTSPGKGAEWLFARYDLIESLKLALINGFISKIDGLVAEIRATGADVDISSHDCHVTLRDGILETELQRIADAIAARNAARARKDFKEADRIRDELLAQGIVLKDGPGGTTWEVKR